MKKVYSIYYLFFLILLGFMLSCSNDDNPMEMQNEEEEEEVISQVTLTFTSDNGEETVIAVWFDADGEGTGAPTIDDIKLKEGVTYTLEMELTNTLGATDEDITAEIQAEANEHMFFFGFTDGIFADPSGDGNIDNRNDPLNYEDQDSNGLPLGLETIWTAGERTENNGEFNIILKHQPDMKTAASNATIGGTDVNITFSLAIE